MDGTFEAMAAKLAASQDIDVWSAVEGVKESFEGALDDYVTLGGAAAYGLVQEAAARDAEARIRKAALLATREIMAVRSDMGRVIKTISVALREKRARPC